MPNGEIQVYNLLRYPLGFDDSGASEAPNCCQEFALASDSISEDCSVVTTSTTTADNFLDDELDPFSFYLYCIVATNNVESGFSSLTTPTQTSPAPMPRIGPTLNATTINSTAIYLEWEPLETPDLLGPLEGYTLYVRTAATPGIGDALFEGEDILSFIATGLLASTEYTFVVEVSNRIGSAFGNNASATTEEGSKLL